MSIESVMLSNYLPSVFPNIRVFSGELAFHIRWPKYWSFSISPSNEYSGLISFRIDWFDFLAIQGILSLHYGPVLCSLKIIMPETWGQALWPGLDHKRLRPEITSHAKKAIPDFLFTDPLPYLLTNCTRCMRDVSFCTVWNSRRLESAWLKNKPFKFLMIHFIF